MCRSGPPPDRHGVDAAAVDDLLVGHHAAVDEMSRLARRAVPDHGLARRRPQALRADQRATFMDCAVIAGDRYRVALLDESF
jgi:hypothetical protein